MCCSLHYGGLVGQSDSSLVTYLQLENWISRPCLTPLHKIWYMLQVIEHQTYTILFCNYLPAWSALCKHIWYASKISQIWVFWVCACPLLWVNAEPLGILPFCHKKKELWKCSPRCSYSLVCVTPNLKLCSCSVVNRIHLKHGVFCPVEAEMQWWPGRCMWYLEALASQPHLYSLRWGFAMVFGSCMKYEDSHSGFGPYGKDQPRETCTPWSPENPHLVPIATRTMVQEWRLLDRGK